MKLERSSKKARVISFMPDGEYYYQKGISAYQKGDLYRAKKFVERAIDFNPNEPEYLCQEAAILAELELYEESIHLLKKVVNELDESMTECYFFMANNYSYLGRYEDAIRELKLYISLDPRGGFIQEARELYRILVMESTSNMREEDGYVADHEKGRQALERGQNKKAIHFFKKVIQDRPEFWPAYNNLAIAYFSMGETAKSYDVLESILEKDAGNVHALCNLVTFYDRQEDTANLERMLNTLDNIYPMYPEHRNKLGATYFFIGDYEKAYHWLKSADRAGAYWDQPFYYWLALTSYRMGRHHEALRAWEKVDFFSETPFEPLEYGKIIEMLEADDAKENPLVRSLLNHELTEGQLDAKIFSLFFFKYIGDDAALEQIRKSARSTRETTVIRSIARALINDHLDERLAIMQTLEEKWGSGKPLVEQVALYDWWRILFEKLSDETESIDINAWAASLEYLWKKENQEKVSQTDIAQKYETTIYRLKKCFSKWESFYTEEEQS